MRACLHHQRPWRQQPAQECRTGVASPGAHNDPSRAEDRERKARKGRRRAQPPASTTTPSGRGALRQGGTHRHSVPGEQAGTTAHRATHPRARAHTYMAAAAARRPPHTQHGPRSAPGICSVCSERYGRRPSRPATPSLSYRPPPCSSQPQSAGAALALAQGASHRVFVLFWRAARRARAPSPTTQDTHAKNTKKKSVAPRRAGAATHVRAGAGAAARPQPTHRAPRALAAGAAAGPWPAARPPSGGKDRKPTQRVLANEHALVSLMQQTVALPRPVRSTRAVAPRCGHQRGATVTPRPPASGASACATRPQPPNAPAPWARRAHPPAPLHSAYSSLALAALAATSWRTAAPPDSGAAGGRPGRRHRCRREARAAARRPKGTLSAPAPAPPRPPHPCLDMEKRFCCEQKQGNSGDGHTHAHVSAAAQPKTAAEGCRRAAPPCMFGDAKPSPRSSARAPTTRRAARPAQSPRRPRPRRPLSPRRRPPPAAAACVPRATAPRRRGAPRPWRRRPRPAAPLRGRP